MEPVGHHHQGLEAGGQLVLAKHPGSEEQGQAVPLVFPEGDGLQKPGGRFQEGLRLRRAQAVSLEGFLGLADQILQPGAVLLIFRGNAVGGHIDGHTRGLGRGGENSQLISGEYSHIRLLLYALGLGESRDGRNSWGAKVGSGFQVLGPGRDKLVGSCPGHLPPSPTPGVGGVDGREPGISRAAAYP